MTGPLASLDQSLAAVGEVLAGVRHDQWTAPTPCSAWHARELVAHLVSGNLVFDALLRGDRPAPPSTALDDPVTAFGSSATELQDAFAGPGALARPVVLPVASLGSSRSSTPGPAAARNRVVLTPPGNWSQVSTSVPGSTRT